MSDTTLKIKPNNHTIYQCPSSKKIELINQILSQNKELTTLIITSESSDFLKESLKESAVSILSDRELVAQKESPCQLLISYDTPAKAILYMHRVAQATQKAIILLDESEQKELYQIEMLLGRAIKQEKIEGFTYPPKEKRQSTKPAYKKLSPQEIKEEARKRYEEKTQEPKEYTAPKRERGADDKWAKKKKEANKFLGKDENGKALFSGKTGDRNHKYDGTPKAKYDAPKAGGRKISINSFKKKETPEDKK